MHNDMNNNAHSYEGTGFSTQAIHVGNNPDRWDSRCVVPPLVMSTTFKQYSPGVHAGYEYGRSGNPTRQALEECLAPLEKAKYALAFSSGLGATTALSYLMETGNHVLLVDDVYGGTNRFFRHCAARMGIHSSFVDMCDLKLTEEAIKRNTAMLWIETPTNPMLKLIDIKAVAELAKKINPHIIVVVDNTFSSSYFQTPLELGADVVVHSLTKYMNGHSDVVMGAIMTNNENLFTRLKFLQNALGIVPSPFDCSLVNRSLKTLSIRMKEHMANGLRVAQALEKNTRIEKIIYPGLESHPQHELYKRQMKGFGGMISIYVKGGLLETSTFLKELKIFSLAESLGGYESLIEHPAIMTHASVPKDQRDRLGIVDNLVRISVGLEDADDLVHDLNQALAKAVLLCDLEEHPLQG
jgi:cystathionine gamma-lyase